ncbi:MAG: DUF2877 domain-containing protein [Anaerolineales bacterium]|nr:DUF2877 domain-containing protein [Anaerolineales bacterium]
MQLQAASIGEAIPRDNFDALIRSVFDSAVNMRLEGADRLITLLISDHDELPQGIRITDKNPALQSLTVGLRATCRGGILRFDSSPITIDLRGAPIWRCRVTELNTDMQSPSVIEAWSTAWDLLNKQQRLKKTELIAGDLFKLNTGSLLAQKLGKSVLQLVPATEQFDVQGCSRAAEKMIGLGPGVTPSGDDLLIGYLAGLWSTAGSHQQQSSFIRSFGISLMKMAKQTNEISRTYLYHAIHGQFSSNLSTLAEAITTGHQIEKAIQAAMRVGHSSGMDSVTGLLIGLAVWNQKSPNPLASRGETGTHFS